MTKKISQAEARRVLQELEKRKDSRIDWKGQSFPAQWDFITDKSQLKAAQCTRRAGKSYSAGLYMVKEAMERPNTKIVYIAKTRESAKRIMKQDIIDEVLRKLKINAQWKAQELAYHFANGSSIMIVGADNSESEMDKLLGQKFKLAVIDESAFFKQDLHKLVYEILKPAMADLKGTIAMISTTSDLTTGLYYDVTNDIEKGWSVHKWSAIDNPHMSERFQEEIADMKELNPLIVETPMFKRMYENQWVIDTDARVYKYDRNLNTIDSLPELSYNERMGHKWQYVMGIDLGWNDATAFVVLAYHPLDGNRKLYVVDTYKASDMTGDDVADKIRFFQKKYGGVRLIIDPASKQFIEDLRARYGFHFISAQKSDKKGHIGMLNSDLLLGKIKLNISADNTVHELEDELVGLIWDVKARERGKYKEHDACENHLCDSFLYAWRYTYAYVNDPSNEVLDSHANSKDPVVVQRWLDKWEEDKAYKIEQQKYLDENPDSVSFGDCDDDEGWGY